MKHLLWLAALAACAGSDDEPPGDDTGDGELRTVTAHEALDLRGADGEVDRSAIDLNRAVIQAAVRADDGTWTVAPGEGTRDGVLTITRVPAGDAIVRVDYHDPSPEPRPRHEYFWARGDADVDLDLGTWRAGRADARYAETSPTDLALELTNLAAWQPGNDLLVLYAPNVGFVNVFAEDVPDAVSGMPGAGATASEVHIDWVNAVGGPLLSMARGDRAHAMQFRFRELAGTFVGAPVRAGLLPGFTQTDGEPTAVGAALSDAGGLSIRLAMDRAAFDALRPELGAGASAAIGRGFAISSIPSAVEAEFSLASLPAELVVVDDGGLDGTGRWDLGDLAVASPFEPDTVYGRFVSAYRVPVERDDGLTAQVVVEVGAITHDLPTEAAPAAPIVGPARAITINGIAAATAPTGVGLTPTIAWQPPALGDVREYEVKILAPGGADPTYDFLWYPAAIFHVPGDLTSLALPPDTLAPGLPHVIAIRAIASGRSPEDHAAAPRLIALPYGWADTITPAFEP
jgi:hypothetical protein